MQTAFTLFGFVLLPVFIGLFIAIHKFVKHEAEQYPTQWENDGKPSLTCGVSGHFTLNLRLLSWLFSTPEWAREDDTALRLLRYIRIGSLVWNIGMLICFYLAYSELKHLG